MESQRTLNPLQHMRLEFLGHRATPGLLVAIYPGILALDP